MKDKIKKYVDSLFVDIYDTKQLRELKEEISANLLEKINDYILRGESKEMAFEKAVSSLGDMRELVESLKKVSETKYQAPLFTSQPLDRKHVLGYVAASAVLLLGIMVSGIVYLQHKELLKAIATLTPFILLAAPLYIYLGLTQETAQDYGMNSRRALLYTVASEVLLLGATLAGTVYFRGEQLFMVLLAALPFVIVSVVIFIYLGLTEKSRRKMGSEWEKQWVDYYSNPQTAMLRGTISGALWLFTIAAFFLVLFIWGWKFSWIVFIVAVGCESLIESYFASKRKNK